MVKYFYFKWVLLVSVLSFVFHFAWEWFQCGPFFIHRADQATPLSMVVATLGDLIITYGILGIVYVLKNIGTNFFPEYSQIKKLIFIEIVSLFVAVGIEKFALATNRWSYTDINPIIPILKVSFLPVLQLMLLTPIILYITAAILKSTQLKGMANAL